MAATYVAAAAGETIVALIESSPGSGTYVAPASINLSRSIDLMTDVETTVIPRTDIWSAPGKKVRVVTALDWKVQGQGILNTGDDLVWTNWWASGATKNVQLTNANTGGVVLTGAAVLTALSISSDGVGKRANISVTIEGADIPTITTHA